MNIHIVGGGVAGTIAALILEKYGIEPTIWESSDRLGGRLRTDDVDGINLDVGFQVLLSAYPKAKEYLDYEKLDSFAFDAGALVVSKEKQQTFGDPLRNKKFLLPTLLSNVGSLSDKLKIFKLSKELKTQSVEALFEKGETTTMEYLKRREFSDRIISNFFQPFFGGIFLENKLDTSSRMFEFVYKMFAEGVALLPKKGIATIPEQLVEKLEKTTLNLDKGVKAVEYQTVILDTGEKIKADYIIVATDPSTIVSNLRNQEQEWRTCKNLYFKVDKQPQKGLIRIVSEQGAVINNFHCFEASKEDNFDIVSATIIDPESVNRKDLINVVQQELGHYIKTKSISLIKEYSIPQALPKLSNIRYDLSFTETKLNDCIYLAGDHMLNASLNAAMISGERAAQAVLYQLGVNVR